MRILRQDADVHAIIHPGILKLIRQRLADMGLVEPYDQYGELIVVESGDNPASLESNCGCWITTDVFSEARYGDADFTPSFEWLEHHPGCFEMLFVISDDGFGTVLFIPDTPDIDPVLLSFCREYAIQAVEAE